MRKKQMINYEELSKEVSYALRHAPWEYELEMDEEGWVSVEQLVDALNKDMKWIGTSEDDLLVMIDKSEKKRHEISGGKIRAFYGHSIPMHIKKEKMIPPDILYHGTARRFLSSIKINGLLPQGRQYVHLSQDISTAQSVGLRRDNKPCVLQIDAKRAWEDGILFYFGNEKVWLADVIPSKYITEIQLIEASRFKGGSTTIDDVTEMDWYNYYRDTYGKENVCWESCNPSEVASAWQGSYPYTGVDAYTNITLHDGDIIYMGEPFPTGYSITSEVAQTIGNDAQKVFGGLQVKPYYEKGMAYAEYRSKLTPYKVHG